MSQRDLRQALIKDWRVTITSCFGLGFVPFAPGTFTSIVAVVVWWYAFRELPLTLQSSVVVAAIAIGFVSVKSLTRHYGVEDEPAITIDELAGQWLALLCIPDNFIAYTLAFVYFRLTDIGKPYPISWLEKNLEVSVGVMADDLAAGVLTIFLVYATLFGIVFISTDAWHLLG